MLSVAENLTDIRTNDQAIAKLLECHPMVAASVQPGDTALEFRSSGRLRRILVGPPTTSVGGLLELSDNNPVVCADTVCLPPPVSTLALIALGPLLATDLLVEAPGVSASMGEDPGVLQAWLEFSGLKDSCAIGYDEADLGGVVALAVMASIRTPDVLEDLDDLYAERYTKSFFVRNEDKAEWHVDLVRGMPYACYRLRIASDQPQSLLTVRAMADLNGKCGAAQVVHAFNIMNGFEEFLGLV